MIPHLLPRRFAENQKCDVYLKVGRTTLTLHPNRGSMEIMLLYRVSEACFETQGHIC
jgi:hypothetical protein